MNILRSSILAFGIMAVLDTYAMAKTIIYPCPGSASGPAIKWTKGPKLQSKDPFTWNSEINSTGVEWFPITHHKETKEDLHPNFKVTKLSAPPLAPGNSSQLLTCLDENIHMAYNLWAGDGVLCKPLDLNTPGFTCTSK